MWAVCCGRRILSCSCRRCIASARGEAAGAVRRVSHKWTAHSVAHTSHRSQRERCGVWITEGYSSSAVVHSLVCSSAVRCDDTPGGNGSIRIIRSPRCPVNPCSRPASSCSFEQQSTSSSHRLTMDQQQCVAVWKSQTQTRTWRD